MFINRFIGAILFVAGALLAATGTANAGPLEHEFGEDSWFVEFDCDGLITLQSAGSEQWHVLVNQRGPDGLPYGQANISGSNTFTNPDTGKTFTATWQLLDKDLKVTDNGDGTATIRLITTGPVKFYGPDGRRMFIDTGLREAELVYDYVNDEEISWTFARFVGRVDTYGRDFCTDMAEFLG
jgi:hypothetical protein